MTDANRKTIANYGISLCLVTNIVIFGKMYPAVPQFLLGWVACSLFLLITKQWKL